MLFLTQDASLGVSPPTRGWTPKRACSKRASGGFPAHAGMDRILNASVK